MPPADAPRRGPTRFVPAWLLALAALLLVARLAAVFYERAHPPRVVDLIEWRLVATAEAESRSTGRPVLYDFSAEWCGPCRIMEREVFADRQSAEAINKLFVPVHLVDRMKEEGRNPPEVGALEARFGIEAFPTLVVAPADGSRPTVIVGYPGKAALMQRLTEAGVKARLQRGLGR